MEALQHVVLPSDDGAEGAPSTAPQQQYIDVHFANAPVHLHWIAFENYYCASLTILHCAQPAAAAGTSADGAAGASAEVWTPVVERLALMVNPHIESDAQAWHELHSSAFAPGFDAAATTRLRFCLCQPSPMWREHGLRKLTFYTARPPGPPAAEDAAELLPELTGPLAERCHLVTQQARRC